MLAPQLGSGVYVLMLDPDHVGTSVPVLLVWLLLDRAPRRWYVPLAVTALLTRAQVADSMATIIGALPLLVVPDGAGPADRGQRLPAVPGAGNGPARAAGPGPAARQLAGRPPPGLRPGRLLAGRQHHAGQPGRVPVQSWRGTISRGGWETDAAWYDPLRHTATFLVLPPGQPGLGYPWSFDARATFGQPARIYDDGPYTVLVWNRNLLTGLR